MCSQRLTAVEVIVYGLPRILTLHSDQRLLISSPACLLIKIQLTPLQMKVSTEYPLPKRGLPPIIAENKVHGFEITSLNFPQFDENKRMLDNQRRAALVKWGRSSKPHLLVKVEAGTEDFRVNAV
ncbi:hypothetical protein AVEN_10967-1 [Araneus ventricosus]|uniref:Uncharacterized protein n=1 Tax=Araneus ventricosus TaxID=182803 RepID=A0A4Y2UN22_ARAVE|nr:hypothetical protein AVEN_10967-1 [Araneus ventricosus]